MARNLMWAAALLALVLLQTGSARAADETSFPSPSDFGRDLVKKVKKGAIYIWAMDAMDLSPAWIGSGFIFQGVPEENAAYALTNHHVAQGTALMQCETWDHQTFKAQLVATEPGIDVALIKIYNIPPEAYEANVLGDSDKVQIGDPALAIGAPGSRDSHNTNRSDPSISFGLHQTATMRVVMGRHSDPFEFIGAWAYWRMDLGREVVTNMPYRFVVQSSINGGNSGGPLYNADGEVIGLNHAHFGAGSAITQNENYTIPINMAKNFAYQILNTGKYEIPWMGLDMIFPPDFIPQGMNGGSSSSQAMTEWVEKYYDPKVLTVYGVRRNSEASRAGVKRGDVIVEFDGLQFDNVTDLRVYIFSLPTGKEVSVTLKRGKETLKLVVPVGVKRGYDSEFSI